MEASWRFSLCSTTKIITRPWFYYMDNDDNSDSDDEDSNQLDGKSNKRIIILNFLLYHTGYGLVL